VSAFPHHTAITNYLRDSPLAVTALLLKLDEVGVGLREERPDARVLSSCLELRHVYHGDDLLGRLVPMARRVGVEPLQAAIRAR
jgi:hypothetical protein